MTTLKTLVFSLALALPGAAVAADGSATPDGLAAWQADPTRIFDASEVSLDAFRWVARPVIVFAETELNPDFQRQIALLQARIEVLAERDVIVITDSDPDAASELRLKLRPRGFMLAIVGKDGEVKLRKPSPWDVREITRSIDKMPLRQQELRDARTATE